MDSNGLTSAGPTASQNQKLWRFKDHCTASEQKWQHYMRDDMIDFYARIALHMKVKEIHYKMPYFGIPPLHTVVTLINASTLFNTSLYRRVIT